MNISCASFTSLPAIQCIWNTIQTHQELFSGLISHLTLIWIYFMWKLGLQKYEHFPMIEILKNMIMLSNFEKSHADEHISSQSKSSKHLPELETPVMISLRRFELNFREIAWDSWKTLLVSINSYPNDVFLRIKL